MENQTPSQALISKGWKYFIIVGVIVALAGLGATSLPVMAGVTITTIMIVVMIFNGLTRMIFGFTNKNLPGSGMVILSGLLSVAIGGYFFFLLDNPEFSLSLLGTFVGVSLIFEGMSFIFLGLRMKKLVNNQ